MKLEFKEIAKRITGFSIPVFGVQWTPGESEAKSAKRVITFLEDRRVLYNAAVDELAHECVQSIFMIREKMTEEIGRIPDNSELSANLRAIRTLCRRFLDRIPKEDTPETLFFHPRPGPFQHEFFTLLGELRASIAYHIAAIAVKYGIDVEEDLAKTLPDLES